MLLFSHMEIPKDILIDQGAPFISCLIVYLCQLLQMKHLRMSIYHPQIDGLIECFNQTLKQMLQWVVDEEGRIWDLGSPLFLLRDSNGPHRIHPFQAPLGTVGYGPLNLGRTALTAQLPQRVCIGHARVDQLRGPDHP